MSQLYEDVGRNIRFYRKLKKLTQAELGGLMNFDPSYLGKIERGEVNVSLETVERIAASLEIAPNILFENTNKNSSPTNRVYLEKINIMLASKSSHELKHIQQIIKEILQLQNIDENSM